MATIKEKIDLVQSYINKQKSTISPEALKALETVIEGGKNYDKMSSQEDKDLAASQLDRVYLKVKDKMSSMESKPAESKASKPKAAPKEAKKTKSGADRKKPDPASTVMGKAKQIMADEKISWAEARKKAADFFRAKKKDGAEKPKAEKKPVVKKEKISEKKKIARKPRAKKAAPAPKVEKKEAPKAAPKKATKKKITRKSKANVPQGKERDAGRPAKHSGFRKTSTTTNKRGGYYEYRENRTDKQNKRYPMLENGGDMEYATGGFFGGREYPTGAAWHKEMKYRSGEKHEKKYKRKRNPKNARYKKYDDGGDITQKSKYEVGDKIQYMDTFRREKKDGTINQVYDNGTYVVNTGMGIRAVNPEEVLGAYPKSEAKKKRFGIFENGGNIKEINKLEKRLQQLNNHFSDSADELGEYMFIVDRLRELNAENVIPADWENVENQEDYIMYSDKMAFGGRPKSATMRDRAYKSNERWEQAYQRKKEPTNPRYNK